MSIQLDQLDQNDADFAELAEMLKVNPADILYPKLRERILRDNARLFLADRPLDQFIWQKHPVKGVEMVRLAENYQSCQFSYLVRCQPQISYPAHQHAGEEEILILTGDIRFGDRTYYANDYLFCPAGSEHPAAPTEHGCVFFVEGCLDDRYPFAWGTYRLWAVISFRMRLAWAKLTRR